MGSRELLLTIGAITIFAVITTTVNRLMLFNSEAIVDQEVEFFAASVAQRFIEEAKTKAFDETTIVGNPLLVPAGFTLAPLGPEPGEAYPNFDDVDDFNGYTTTLATTLGDMTVNAAVNYVSEANLDSVVTLTNTFYKRMAVKVQSEYLDHAVSEVYVFTFLKNF